MLISPVAVIVIMIWLLAFMMTLVIKRSPAALAGGMVFGLLFLPQFTIDLPFLPLTKPVLLAMVTAGGCLFLDKQFRVPLRPSLLDLPVIALCGAGFGASLSNALGAYDGLHSAIHLFCVWGIPYLIGRFVFATQRNALTLIRFFILGGLVYVPLCAYEFKMSPVLHPMVFGYVPRGNYDGMHAIRYGMWRPTVFMEMGLQLSLFMGLTCVAAIWGVVTGKILKVAYLPCWVVAVVLGVTTILCVSTGAILLTFLGLALLVLPRFIGIRILLMILIAVPVAYPVYRMVNPGSITIESPSKNEHIAARQASLRFRIENESLYIRKWKDQPFLGWTPWYLLDGRAIPDSMWIQILFCYGLFGWSGLTATLVLPYAVVWFRRNADNSILSSAYVFGLIVFLFAMDCMLNAMENPIYIVMAGATMMMIEQEPNQDKEPSVKVPRRKALMQRMLWPPGLVDSQGSR